MLTFVKICDMIIKKISQETNDCSPAIKGCMEVFAPPECPNESFDFEIYFSSGNNCEEKDKLSFEIQLECSERQTSALQSKTIMSTSNDANTALSTPVNNCIRDTASVSEDNSSQLSESNASESVDSSGKSLYKAASYLIDLYEATCHEDMSPRYSCSTTKLGKLLTLAVWINALSLQSNESPLFFEDVIAKRCGTTIRGLTLDISNKDFTVGDDKNRFIDRQEIVTKCDPQNQIEKLLFFVFQNFGAYESCCLGKYIDLYKFDSCKEDSAIAITDFHNNFCDNENRIDENNSLAMDKLRFKGEALKKLSVYIDKWKEIQSVNTNE